MARIFNCRVYCGGDRHYVDLIESVQQHFLLFALRNLAGDPSADAFENMLELMDLPSL